MSKSQRMWRAVLAKVIGKQLVARVSCVTVARAMAQKKTPCSTKTPSVTHVLASEN